MEKQLPRGIRLNNAGNIRHGTSTWVGMSPVQPDADFVQFDAPEWGIRALAKILLHYKSDGINTIEGVINRYAPPSENDTGSYVDHVCNLCGVHAGQVVDIAEYLPKLIPAIIAHENGCQPYEPETIEKGISLA